MAWPKTSEHGGHADVFPMKTCVISLTLPPTPTQAHRSAQLPAPRREPDGGRWKKQGSLLPILLLLLHLLPILLLLLFHRHLHAFYVINSTPHHPDQGRQQHSWYRCRSHSVSKREKTGASYVHVAYFSPQRLILFLPLWDPAHSLPVHHPGSSTLPSVRPLLPPLHPL